MCRTEWWREDEEDEQHGEGDNEESVGEMRVTPWSSPVPSALSASSAGSLFRPYGTEDLEFANSEENRERGVDIRRAREFGPWELGREYPRPAAGEFDTNSDDSSDFCNANVLRIEWRARPGVAALRARMRAWRRLSQEARRQQEARGSMPVIENTWSDSEEHREWRRRQERSSTESLGVFGDDEGE